MAAGLGLYALFVNSAHLISGFPADLTVPWIPIGTAVAAALLLAPLDGMLPALWAARMDVVDALRYE